MSLTEALLLAGAATLVVYTLLVGGLIIAGRRSGVYPSRGSLDDVLVAALALPQR